MKGLIHMVISAIIEKVKKELQKMWTSETTLPNYVPGGMAGRQVPKNKISIAVFFILILFLAYIFHDAAANTDTVPLPGGGGGGNVELDVGRLDPIDGYSQEYSERTELVDMQEKAIAEITFTLTWEDEAPPAGFQNHPDEFSLNVTTPWGDSDETPMTENDQNTRRGEISLTFQAPGAYPDTGSAGEFVVIIRMGEAGDVWPLGIPSVGFADNGNDWRLSISYTYWKPASSPITD